MGLADGLSCVACSNDTMPSSKCPGVPGKLGGGPGLTAELPDGPNDPPPHPAIDIARATATAATGRFVVNITRPPI